MCPFFLLSLLETKEGGEWGAGGPVAGVLGLCGGRGRGKRGRAAPGTDSPPQFQRRGPVAAAPWQPTGPAAGVRDGGAARV
jgi:hypothetical protein